MRQWRGLTKKRAPLMSGSEPFYVFFFFTRMEGAGPCADATMHYDPFSTRRPRNENDGRITYEPNLDDGGETTEFRLGYRNLIMPRYAWATEAEENSSHAYVYDRRGAAA